MGFFDFIAGAFEAVVSIFTPVAETVTQIASSVVEAGSVLFAAAGDVVSQGFSGFADLPQNLVGSIFGEGLLTDTLAGALQGAGYGALAGGAVSALTGGDFLSGAGQGALYGSVAGGAGGFLNSQYTLANPTQLQGQAGTGLNAGSPIESPQAGQLPVGSTDPSDLGQGALSSPAATSAATPVVGVPAAATPVPKRAGLLGFWDEIKNSELAGGVVGGVIQGVGAGLLADSEAEQQRDNIRLQSDLRAQERRDAYVGSTNGLLTRGQGTTQPATPRPSPTERFGSGTLSPSFRYDAGLGRIVTA